MSFNQEVQGFKDINQLAHINYLHPNRMPWQESNSAQELDFLSRALVGEAGQEEKAVAYLYKELAQLAEIEMHVSAVMTQILCELQSEATPQIQGDGLYHAISCFAAEEINHANSFYQYVRHLSGRDIKLTRNFADERIGLYHGDDSPLLKLAALCATAYVGESVITVFERRMKLLDPMQHHFLTRLLHNHGLDEARHIQCDHMVFDTIIPSFSASERRRMHEIIGQTEALNTALALASQETIQAAFDLDYTENNFAAKTQLDMTLKFREIIQSGDYIKKVDEHLDDDTTQILQIFANASQIHAA